MSKRRNHPNFRTKVKHLLKDYQRGEISDLDIRQWFAERGIASLNYHKGYSRRSSHGHLSIVCILNSSVPSRIFSRLGNAALKKNCFVRLHDIIHPICEYHHLKFFPMISLPKPNEELNKEFDEIFKDLK